MTDHAARPIAGEPGAPSEARQVPKAPSFADLPPAKQRSVRGGADIKEISVKIKVVTPILGGGTQTRNIDEVDIIRAATVRGHLRFWWRALQGSDSRFADPESLFEEEGKLWGSAATEEGGRSAVDLRIGVGEYSAEPDKFDIDAQARDAYALWPAREQKGERPAPTAPRRKPGTLFTLTLRCPAEREQEVRNTVRAWLLFGGYGGRTRRGVGSLTVTEDHRQWLPSASTPKEIREAIKQLFGHDIFAHPHQSPTETPWLDGASVHVGAIQADGSGAWHEALRWLRIFRQGAAPSKDSKKSQFARHPDPDGRNRPSISNWPEADKIRQLTGKREGHGPRHNATPAWPRAGFGLPIIGQFQTKARDGRRIEEPRGFELRWRSGPDQKPADRLASPLIVKALPLADGKFVPCALWLNRTYPQGEVFAMKLEGSAAPFDRLVAAGDTPQFDALIGRQTLREAFLAWLGQTVHTTEVAP